MSAIAAQVAGSNHQSRSSGPSAARFPNIAKELPGVCAHKTAPNAYEPRKAAAGPPGWTEQRTFNPYAQSPQGIGEMLATMCATACLDRRNAFQLEPYNFSGRYEMAAASATGSVTVYESSDAGSGDPTKTFWQFFVDTARGPGGTIAVRTRNVRLAETMRFAIETKSKVRVSYDDVSFEMDQARIEFTSPTFATD